MLSCWYRLNSRATLCLCWLPPLHNRHLAVITATSEDSGRIVTRVGVILTDNHFLTSLPLRTHQLYALSKERNEGYYHATSVAIVSYLGETHPQMLQIVLHFSISGTVINIDLGVFRCFLIFRQQLSNAMVYHTMNTKYVHSLLASARPLSMLVPREAKARAQPFEWRSVCSGLHSQVYSTWVSGSEEMHLQLRVWS